MRATKGLVLLCWLGPAELVDFIKRQINARRGWSALGDVALPSWLGLCFLCSLHPSKPNCAASGVTLAVHAQLVWVLAQRSWPQRCIRRKSLSRGEHTLLLQQGWHWPSLPVPAQVESKVHLTLLLSALLHPTDPRDPPQNPAENSSSTSLGNSLPIFAFTAIPIFSRPHPWNVVTFQQLLIITLRGQVFKKLLQKLWIVLKEHSWICSCWIQYYNQLWKIL